MKNSAKLGLLALTMINVAAIANLRSLPMMAGYGLKSIAYFVLVAILFFIPTALVSAELATGWPKKGGVFVWVSEALGEKVGLLAIWLQWAQNLVWYPTVLSFAAGTFAYAITPELVHDKFYTLALILIAYWIGTFANFFGMKASGTISGIAVTLGTIFPAILIISFGIWWLFAGDPSQIVLTPNAIMPDPHGLSSLVLASGVLMTFVGMEMSAAHASETENPQRNYPRAIFFAAVIILAISILGTLAVGVVLPQGSVNIVDGLITAFKLYLKAFGLEEFFPFIGLLIAFGVFGQASTWIPGPSKGLLAAAEHGFLPKALRRVNSHGVQVPILLVQGICVTAFSCVFLFLPSMATAYWILNAFTTEVYLLMYALMFISAIRLRYSKPNVKRAYRIPFGNWGMWCVSGLGFLGAIGVMGVSYILPQQIKAISPMDYAMLLGLGLILVCIPPFILFRLRTWFKG